MAKLIRRDFLKWLCLASLAPSCQTSSSQTASDLFSIGLNQKSLLKSFKKKQLDPADFPRVSSSQFQISKLSFANQFYLDYKKQNHYWQALDQQCKDTGSQAQNLLCQEEGFIGHPNKAKRLQAINKHLYWLDNAKTLNCQGIRIFALSENDLHAREQAMYCSEGVRLLAEYAEKLGLEIAIENHSGVSANPHWLKQLIKSVGMPNCRIQAHLNQFGNFNPYLSIRQVMPVAQSITATSHIIKNGDLSKADLARLSNDLVKSKCPLDINIQYNGHDDEFRGIKDTKRELLEIRESLFNQYS